MCSNRLASWIPIAASLLAGPIGCGSDTPGSPGSPESCAAGGTCPGDAEGGGLDVQAPGDLAEEASGADSDDAGAPCAPCPASGNPCQVSACNPTTGLCEAAATPDGAACDDGVACTLGDICTSGSCSGVPNAAACDAGDNPCAVTTCAPGPGADPVTGCVAIPLADGSACPDADACTTASACSQGACAGDPVPCSDGDSCTEDHCDPTTGCAFPPVSGPCDDGTACTTNDMCSAGACAGSPLACDDQSVCTDDACDPATGCVFTPIPCVDDIACTEDACDPASGCSHTPKSALCDDQVACTTDVCDGGCLHEVSDEACDDGDACTKDDCDAQEGCANAPIPCDDGFECTIGDKCVGGLCVLTPKDVLCDDLVACTKDACVIGSGCTHTPDVALCGDGNACTADQCDLAGCHHAPVADGAPCPDQSACTTAELCTAGKCASKALACDDGNPCTNDSCDPALGCLHAPSNALCDDGYACTVSDKCVGGACTGTPLNALCDDAVACTQDTCQPKAAADASGCIYMALDSACDDAKACTHDVCDLKKGCRHPNAPDGTLCDDGKACTAGDACVAGSCVPLGDAVFSRTAGHPGYEFTTALVALDDGSGFALGGTTNYVNANDKDFWLVRLDIAGNKLWERTYERPGNDSAGAIVERPEGGFVLAGTAGTCAKGGTCIRLVWTDEKGDLLTMMDKTYDKTYDEAGDQGLGSWVAPNALKRLSNGNLAVAGSKGTDGWLLILDPSGNVLNTDPFGGPGWTYAGKPGGASTFSSVAELPNGGGLLLGGQWWEPAESNLDGWLVIEKGSIVSAPKARTYGGAGQDYLMAATPLADGSVAAVGVSGGNWWLLRTDKDLNQPWERTYGGSSYERAWDLEPGPDGSLLILGYTEAGPAGGWDGWLLRTDAFGTPWSPSGSKTFGGAQTDFLFDLTPLPDGGYALAGTRESDYPATTAGDAWLVRTDAWGNIDCASTGSCMQKAPTECDEGNACTADVCQKGACMSQDLPAPSLPLLWSAKGTAWRQSKSCPEGWKAPDFDDSAWSPPEEEGAFGVAPWGALAASVVKMPTGTPASWIWWKAGSQDSDKVCFRASIVMPACGTKISYTMYATADNSFTAWLDGGANAVMSGTVWSQAQKATVSLSPGQRHVLAFEVTNGGYVGGLLVDVR